MEKNNNENKTLILSIIIIIALIILSLFIPHVKLITKKSKKELEEFIITTMEEKYEKKFTIDLIKKEQITECFFEFDGGCGGKYPILGATNYTFKVTDQNNASAYVKYSDPYYDILWSRSKEKFIEEYQYTNDAYERYELYLPKIKKYLGEDIITKIEFKNCDIENIYSPEYSINIYLSSQTIDENLKEKLTLLKSNLNRYEIDNKIIFKNNLNYLKINIVLESNKVYELNEILKDK